MNTSQKRHRSRISRVPYFRPVPFRILDLSSVPFREIATTHAIHLKSGSGSHMNLWWPSSALRRRVRSGTARVPHYVRNVSALFPQHLRSVTALKLSPRTVPAVFPQSFRTVPAAFPHCFRSSRIFLNFCKCLPVSP